MLLGISGVASAGTFTSGTLGISIGALPQVALGSNPVAFTITAGGFLNEPASVFGPATVALPSTLFTGVPIFSGLTLAIANGPKVGTLPSAVGGLAGTAFVNVFALLNLTIPLNVVGGPASGTAMGHGIAGSLITVHGRPWTTGAQVVTGITTTTPGTAVLNTVTFTGSQMGVLSGNATVTLVSPFKVITNVAGNMPGLAFQTLRFTEAVPESTPPESWLTERCNALILPSVSWSRGREGEKSQDSRIFSCAGRPPRAPRRPCRGRATCPAPGRGRRSSSGKRSPAGCPRPPRW